jgi:citrate lyase beta subunit
MTTRIRRALLFMPGDDRHKIEKGAALGVDSVIMDLEDGVALDQKQNARAVTLAALREVAFGQTERLVRINPVADEHPLWESDLIGTIEGNPDGYVLPKVENAAQVQRVAEFLTNAERRYGWLYGSIKLLAIIETAQGVINLKEITGSDSRLAALIFGAEDLAGDIGATRTPDGWEVFYARSAVVIHAAARNLQAIDTPFVNLSAEDSQLIAEAEQAHYMGYSGKLAVHPRQVAPIQRIFTPGAVQIQHAKRLVEAHKAHQAAGQGVFVLDGKMVDMPMVRAAKNVLARARAAGIDVDSDQVINGT